MKPATPKRFSQVTAPALGTLVVLGSSSPSWVRSLRGTEKLIEGALELLLNNR